MTDSRTSLGLIDNDGERRSHLGILDRASRFLRRGTDAIKRKEFSSVHEIKITVPMGYYFNEPMRIDILKPFAMDMLIKQAITKNLIDERSISMHIKKVLPELTYEININATRKYKFSILGTLEILDNDLKELEDINELSDMEDITEINEIMDIVDKVGAS